MRTYLGTLSRGATRSLGALLNVGGSRRSGQEAVLRDLQLRYQAATMRPQPATEAQRRARKLAEREFRQKIADEREALAEGGFPYELFGHAVRDLRELVGIVETGNVPKVRHTSTIVKASGKRAVR